MDNGWQTGKKGSEEANLKARDEDTLCGIVGTGRRQLYLGGTTVRAFGRTDVEGDRREKPKVTSRFLGLNKWKD